MLRNAVAVALAVAIAFGVTVMTVSAADTRVAAQPGGTLVIAAPNTPNGIDAEGYGSFPDQEIRRAVSSFLLKLPLTPNVSGVLWPDYKKVAAGKLNGELAANWSISNGGRTLTVHLRTGVQSHAGNELTAADVQYTWNRMWALKAAGYFYQTNNLYLTRPAWRVVNKNTWQLTTPRPNALLALIMANNDLPILDSTEVKKHAVPGDPWARKWLARHDASFGPYQVASWSPGSEVILTAFKDYFLGAPAFDKIIYRAVPDASQRRTLVESGAVDIAEGVGYSDLAALRSIPSVRVWHVAGNATLKLTLLQKRPVLANVAVRKAILYATPVDQIVRSVFHGFGSAMKGPIAPTEPFAAPQLWNKYKYNPALARKLLRTAGVKPAAASFTISYESSNTAHRDIAAILRTAYNSVGLSVKIQGVPSSAYNSYVWANARAYKLDAAITQFGFNTPDPGYEMALDLTCQSAFNHSAFCNRTFDALLAEGLRTRDPAKRTGIYRRAQRLLADNAVENWIVNPGWQLVTKTDITGVAWDPTGVAYLGLLQRK